MNTEILAGIIILFAISMIVRITPSLITLSFSSQTQYRLKNILPIAVFINLLVYCAYSEAQAHPLATTIATILALIVFRFLGLLASCIIASAVFLWLTKFVFV